MKKQSLPLCILAMVLLTTLYSLGQEGATTPVGVPVHMVVTVEARHGATPPEITREDVMVHEGHDRDRVTEWVPAQGEHSALELFILIDDGASLGSQLEDIRQFINAQPSTTKIGIAYMQNGVARVLQNLTTDHAQAAKAVRLPLGVIGADASPYFSLQDLIKRWPQNTARREVFMVTDGVDWFGGTMAEDPYVDAAITDAQRAGVIVFDIYMPGREHAAHSYWSYYWGQIYLSRVADETGGEAYYIGFTGAPVSFTPYLDAVSQRLNHQYFLGFLAKPEKKSGMRRVRLQTEVPNAELVAASQVYVPASPQ